MRRFISTFPFESYNKDEKQVVTAFRKIQMTLVVRQFVYQHVCISDRIQWFGPIILPMTVFVINSHGK